MGMLDWMTMVNDDRRRSITKEDQDNDKEFTDPEANGQQVRMDYGSEEERIPITNPSTMSRGGGPATRQFFRGDVHNNWLFVAAIFLLLILLATDVTLRLGKTWRTSTTRTPTGVRQWRPTMDILNASGIEDLKYNHDVGNEGLQGLAITKDGRLLYEFHTMGVRILQLDEDMKVVGIQAQRVYIGSQDFPIIIEKHVAHIGGIDLADSKQHGTELWIATHSDGLQGEGALFAVDPTTLDVIRDRAVRVNYNLDWVAYQNGILYFGDFFNVQSVHRVSIDTLEPLPDLELSLSEPLRDGGINYVQSAAFDLEGRLVLLGDDYQCTVYYIDATSGKFLGSQALLLGSEVDGITYDPIRRSMLVGFNRQHSHEQVMQQEPMASIIRLDLY